MARPGRKRKAGRREKSGRPQRDYTHDKGTERIQALRERFDVYYCTALGRAFSGGLLGEDGLDLYQTGMKFAKLHKRVFGIVDYKCALGDSAGGSSLYDEERDANDHQWLLNAIRSFQGPEDKFYMDQLLIHTDQGPGWLDRLLDKNEIHGDRLKLEAAMRALQRMAPAPAPRKILSIVY